MEHPEYEKSSSVGSTLSPSQSRKDDTGTSRLSIPSRDKLEPEKGSRFRKSFDIGSDRLLDRPRSSTDTERRNSSQSSRRISKLLPRRSRDKKRTRKKNAEEKDEDEDSPAGRSGSDVSSPVESPSKASVVNGVNGSVDSLGKSRSIASSLLTEDEDGQSTTRSSLHTQHSHKGYLTVTSPSIMAEPIDPQQLGSPILAPTDTARTGSTPSLSLSVTNLYPSTSSLPQPARRQSPLGRYEESSGLQSVPSNIDINIPTPETPRVHSTVLSSDRLVDTPPNMNQTPSTLVTPPTPDQPRAPSPTIKPTNSIFSINSSSVKNQSHRRSKSAAGPSKYGAKFSILSPAVEEARTPGGTLVQPSASGGFFSSMFSATQNAVNQISSTFSGSQTSSMQHKRSNTDPSIGDSSLGNDSLSEEIIPSIGAGSLHEDARAEFEPAVATLGLGNLSLSHLGISDTISDLPSSHAPISSVDATPGVGQPGTMSKSASITAQMEKSFAAEAVSQAYSEKPNHERVASDSASTRPRSLASVIGNAPGEVTPPRSLSSDIEGTIIRRTGSVRSKFSDRKKRHRGSSSGTGNGSVIAAALGASHAIVANPTATANGSRPTGFAVASSKRNREFHQYFRSVPDNDYLIEDYSAALQRDILLHGRLYISEKHICFASNILGYVTNVVMSFDEVVSMERKSTAVIFPNAIVIQTLHSKNVFASFISRDTTYDLLIGIWRIRHPNLKTTENGHILENTTSVEKSMEPASITSDEGSEEESEEYYQDEGEEEKDDGGSYIEAEVGGNGSEHGDDTKMTVRRISTSPATPSNGAGQAPKATEKADQVAGAGLSAVDFPGPTSHSPTECTDADVHYDKQILDTVIPAPLGKIYSMMFGPASGAVMRKFLVDDQKSGDVQYEDDKKGMDQDIKSFSYSFIKPLGGSIGPKQTKCNVAQTLDHFDLERSVSVTCSTATPDVPSGNAFVVKTRYCLMWAASNQTKLLANATVEWSAKSWLRGPIEKGAADGQEKYGRELAAFLKAQVAATSPTKGARIRAKGKRKQKITDVALHDSISLGRSSNDSQTNSAARGMSGIAQPMLSSARDLFSPLLGTFGIISLLFLLMTYLWIKQTSSKTESRATVSSFTGANIRAAALEEIWHREETDLWLWLEDRMMLDMAGSGLPSYERASLRREQQADRTFEPNIGSVLQPGEQELDEALRTTKKRLDSLKSTIDRKKNLAGE